MEAPSYSILTSEVTSVDQRGWTTTGMILWARAGSSVIPWPASGLRARIFHTQWPWGTAAWETPMSTIQPSLLHDPGDSVTCCIPIHQAVRGVRCQGAGHRNRHQSPRIIVIAGLLVLAKRLARRGRHGIHKTTECKFRRPVPLLCGPCLTNQRHL